MKTSTIVLVAIALAGCASIQGPKLVPGQSTSADVQTAMGAPKEKITNTAGESVWFYPTAPNGRLTYAVRLRPDGTVAAVEQRLTKQYWSQIVPGRTTIKEVRELLGPPAAVSKWHLRPDIEEWDYKVEENNRMFDLLIEASQDGVVRKSDLFHDPIYDAPLPG